MEIRRFGYYWLDTWILANVIQLATQDFCIRYLNRTNDPCGRQYDQMTQAARSVTANIAEGNCLIVLCNRLIMMLGKHLEILLENFKKEGGFTEALTADRLNGGHNPSLTLDDVCNLNRTDRFTLKQVVLNRQPLHNRNQATSTSYSSLLRMIKSGIVVRSTHYEVDDLFSRQWISQNLL